MGFTQALKRRKRQQIYVSCGLLVCLIGFLWLSLISGSNGLNFSDTSKLFSFSSQAETFQMIISSIRLPRALAAIMVGALLGLSGAVMQGVLRNPLASPFTLGISQAAGFGAAIAIIVLPELNLNHPLLYPLV